MEFNFGITGTEKLGGIEESQVDSALFSANPEDVKPNEQAEETPEDKGDKKATPPPLIESGPIGFEAGFESALMKEDQEEEGEKEDTEEVDESLTLPSPQTDLEDEYESDEDSDNPFSSLANDLLELGIFTPSDGDEEIQTPEQFKARWELEKKMGAQQELTSFLSQFGPDRIEAFNAIFVNGVDPRQYLQAQSEIQDFENANIEDEFVQEQVVRSYYKDLGWKEDRISKKIEKLRDYDDLKDEAETVKEKLVEKKKIHLQQVEEQSKAAVQAKMLQKQTYIQNVQAVLSEKIQEKSFDGIPVSRELASQVYDSMTREKWVLPNGEKLSDFDKFLLDLKRPENAQLASKVALLVATGFDFSAIKKEAISKESSELFKSINSKQKVTKRSKASSKATVAPFKF